MLDLRNARNALEQMGESERSDGWGIGRVKRDIDTLTAYRTGEVILVRDDGDNTVTLERPYSPEQIEQRRAEGNSFVSGSCTICVPKDYVEEIRL